LTLTSKDTEAHLGSDVCLPAARRATWVGWAAVFLVAFVLYAATASRGPQWQDSGEHMMRILDGRLLNPRGLALTHPLHYWLGRTAAALHLASPAYAITLISSVAAAAAVANIFGITLALTRAVAPAVLAAASLALAHTFWKMATLVETYTLTALLLSAEVWCVVRFLQSGRVETAAGGPGASGSHALDRPRRAGYLVAAVAFNGLGLANHNLALLTIPVLAGVAGWGVRRGLVRLGHLAVAATLWLIGSSPYTFLVLREGLQSGQWRATIVSALFGHAYADEVLNYTVNVHGLAITAAFIGLNFPNLLIPAAVWGMARAPRRPEPREPNEWLTKPIRRALLATLAIHFLFVVRYNIVDQFTFLLPTYLMLSIFAGIGFAATGRLSAVGRRAVFGLAVVLVAATPFVYLAAPGLAQWAGVLESRQRSKPYRDDYVYLFSAWGRADQSADALAHAVLAGCTNHGLIVVPDSSAMPVVSYAIRKAGRDRVAIRAEFDGVEAAAVLAQGGTVLFVPRTRGDEPPPAVPGRWVAKGDLYALEAAGP
jgi:hypothetical protein